MRWTDRQRQVIETGNRNLLVSAAAGSGKTAVLVERILRLITQGPKPADIDRLLVMTFTNAAAAEMRERIARAIEARLREHPEDEHLQIQAALVGHAQITTIDSFCLSLIRDHFNLLDIDPSFRVGDEGELTLLRADVMEDLLEEYYGRRDPAFERFADTFSSGKSDSAIEDCIRKVYGFAQSHPFPGEWIGECRAELERPDGDGPEGTRWGAYMMKDAGMRFGEMAEQYREILELCRGPEGPEVYRPVLSQELRMLEDLAGKETYGELYEALRAVRFGRLPAARGGDLDPDRKERVAECRNRVKKQVKDLCAAYGRLSPREAMEDIRGTKDAVLKLLELAEAFSDRYREAKKDRNLVDFNDLEHFALQILAERRNGKLVFTETADAVGSQYEEILVDEYQDSNYVQEVLIQSLSRERFGRPNVFMVGDVKQSIYRFRQARPELFMEKYDTYTTEESPCQKIELRRNFRSRAAVLDSVNRIFRRIMTRELGNVAYTEETALHPGAVFAEPPGEERWEARKEAQKEARRGTPGAEAAGGEACLGSNRVGSPTELLLTGTGEGAGAALDEASADRTARETEAALAAARIRELTDPDRGLLIWDKGQNRYRRAGYGDIVILLRSLAGWSEAFIRVLTREGIPAYAETGTGYFNTIEVETVLAMLAVIDNPMQDIPLAAVLRSPMAGLTEEELAWMAAAAKENAGAGQDRGIYRAFRLAAEDGADGRGGETGREGEMNREGETVCEGKTNREGGVDREEEINRGGEASREEEINRGEETSREEETGCGEGGAAGGEEAGPRVSRECRRKVRRFAALLEELRKEAAWLPIHQLIYRVYEKTGYYEYVSAMPAGETRKANLDMLAEKAAAYEKTSYKGLFRFIRYIDLLKKYDTDFGEASAAGRYDRMVRVMSVHKSKGLEFPIVILAGLGKPFNRQDVRGRLLIDSDLGIGTDCLDLERRTKTVTLKKQVMKRKMDMDSLGEELRILYVAMTRAKEKLILTGSDRSLEKKLDRWKDPPERIPSTVLSSASSWLDWVLMTRPQDSPLFLVRRVPAEELAGAEAARQVRRLASREELLRACAGTFRAEGPERDEGSGVAGSPPAGERSGDAGSLPGNEGSGGAGSLLPGEKSEEAGGPPAGEAAGRSLWDEMERCRSYVYPHQADVNLHTKMTVSELKEMSQRVDDFTGLYRAAEADFLKHARRPAHTPEEAADGPREDPEERAKAMERAARRGTAFHRALELLDFTDARLEADVERQMDGLLREGRITEGARALIRPEPLWRLASSPLGQRLKAAQQEGRLYRERPFILGIPAREMGLGDTDERVLVQGIIDAYFWEDGGMVLVDYKTDRVRRGEEERLIRRYGTQLDYYQRALEQITGGRVTERILYSLPLGEAITA